MNYVSRFLSFFPIFLFFLVYFFLLPSPTPPPPLSSCFCNGKALRNVERFFRSGVTKSLLFTFLVSFFFFLFFCWKCVKKILKWFTPGRSDRYLATIFLDLLLRWYKLNESDSLFWKMFGNLKLTFLRTKALLPIILLLLNN